MKTELLKNCRYYKGESSPPKNINGHLWEYEKKWVTLSESKDNALYEYCDLYRRYFPDSFNDGDIPLTLKALLFSRYTHFCGYDINGFTNWFKTIYLMEG